MEWFCTSSNAYKIIQKGLESGKKIFCSRSLFGTKILKSLNLKSAVIGDGSDLKKQILFVTMDFVQFINNFLLKILSFIEKNSLIF